MSENQSECVHNWAYYIICPDNIAPESKVRSQVRVKGNDHLIKKLLIVNKFSLSEPQEMYREQYGEYAYCW